MFRKRVAHSTEDNAEKTLAYEVAFHRSKWASKCVLFAQPIDEKKQETEFTFPRMATSLQQIINHRDYKQVPFNDKLYFIMQLINSLIEVRQHGYCHRDIKPHNAMVDENGKLKLIDFAFAKKARHGSRTQTKLGTLKFLAPEILKQEDYDPYAADCWSLGVTAFLILFGFELFDCFGKKWKTFWRSLISLDQTNLNDLLRNYIISGKGHSNLSGTPAFTREQSNQILIFLFAVLQLEPSKRDSLEDLWQQGLFMRRGTLYWTPENIASYQPSVKLMNMIGDIANSNAATFASFDDDADYRTSDQKVAAGAKP